MAKSFALSLLGLFLLSTVAAGEIVDGKLVMHSAENSKVANDMDGQS